MTSIISDFLSNIKANGLARNNRFRVTFSLPAGMSSFVGNSTVGGSPNEKRLSVMCSATSIPGYSISHIDSSNTGLSRKMPIDRSTGEIELQFYCSGDMMEKKIFDLWINSIFADDMKISYYDSYVTDFTIEQMDIAEDVVYSAVLTECYPGLVGPIVLDRTSMDGLMTFSASFNYRRIQPNDGNVVPNTSAPTVDSLFQNFTSLPRLPQRSLPPAPPLSNAYPAQVVDIMNSIQRVSQEINSGMDPDQGAKILQNLQIELLTITTGIDITPVKNYLSQSITSLAQQSAISGAQGLLG